MHYVQTALTTAQAWTALQQVSEQVKRVLVRSVKGPYVYVPKLSAEQTQSVFNMIKQEISQLGGQSTVKRIWQSSWDIDDAVLPA